MQTHHGECVVSLSCPSLCLLQRKAKPQHKKETNKNVLATFLSVPSLFGIKHKSRSVRREKPSNKNDTNPFLHQGRTGGGYFFKLFCLMVGAASFCLGTFINHSQGLNTRRSNAFTILHWQVPLESTSFNSPVEKICCER